MSRTLLVTERFTLNQAYQDQIRSLRPNFGFNGFGEAVFYRTYSRLKEDGSQEHWADTVLRVTNGIFSIRKDHFIKHHLHWDDSEWQDYAFEFAKMTFNMGALPAGRGIWSMGTNFCYERGSAALNNCGACTTKDLVAAACWIFDGLMVGCGIGADTDWDGVAVEPNKDNFYVYIIPDSREGWVESLRLLLEAYIPNKDGQVKQFPRFDYSIVRPKGAPIKGFGGTSSGPDPLIKLHTRVEVALDTYLLYSKATTIDERVAAFGQMIARLRSVDNDWMSDDELAKHYQTVVNNVTEHPDKKQYNAVRCCADIVNFLGVCVVAGNVRRSAELLLGKPDDLVFRHLKDYKINPERQAIGWMSNNTVRLEKTEDFALLPTIANRIRDNGEPGIYNQLNVTRYGRVGRYHKPTDVWTRENEQDRATLCNPCSEIPLEPFELCNLAEVFPTRCMLMAGTPDVMSKEAEEYYFKALEFATFYASTVSLLATHWPETNKIVARNRRIGVSLSGVADWYAKIGMTEMTRLLRAGYRKVREVNTFLAGESGIPPSIRVTCAKPSGSISQLVGVSSGLHFPTFQYAIRRMRVSDNAAVVPVLKDAGYPWEKDTYSDNTLVFEFPIDQGKTRPATKVSMWEQFSLLVTMNREYSDNMVSVTIYYDPATEGDQLEYALAQYAPFFKSVSVLPHTETGAYVQMPYEGIPKQEYERRVASLKPIDWSNYGGTDGQMPKYCNNDVCEMK